MYREKLMVFSSNNYTKNGCIDLKSFAWKFELRIKELENNLEVSSTVNLYKYISFLSKMESIKTIRFLSQKEGFADIDVSVKDIGPKKSASEFDVVELDKDVFVSNDIIYVKCIVSIDGLPGPQVSNIDFFQPSSRSDVVLIVEGKRMHVNKGHLAMYSKVSEKMFYSDFKEATQEEIKLEDIKWYQFYDLLQQIYPGPDICNGGNLKYLLELADRFDIPQIVYDCERHLLNDEWNSWDDYKTQYADKYDMIELFGFCVNKMDRGSLFSIKRSDFFDDLKPHTKDALFSKSLGLFD